MAKFNRSFGVTAVLTVFAAASMGAAQPAAAQDRTFAVAPVAVTGESAPGTGGLSFGCFPNYWFAKLNESGVVAFKAATTPDPSGNCVDDNGLWVGTPGNAQLLARVGDAAPGTIGQSFLNLYNWSINASGTVAFNAWNIDPLTGSYADTGAWIGSPGNLELLVLSGDIAPGTGGLTYSYPGAGQLDDFGVAPIGGYFGSIYNDLGYGRGLWKGTPGFIEHVLVTGDPATGTDGLIFTDLIGGANAGNYRAIRGETDDPDPSRAEGIWTIGPDGINLIIRAGDEVPGTGGRILSKFWSANVAPPLNPEPLNPSSGDGIALNKQGEIAFTVFLASADPLITYDDEAILVHDAAGLRLAALTGDPAPGTEGVSFLDFNHNDLNNNGLMAFDASLNTPDMTRDHGIWVGTPDNLALLVREGDPAPGTAGETFAHMRFGPSLNDMGDVAFLGKLRESGDSGVWIAAPDGGLALVARTGDYIEVASGDYRKIQSFPRQEGGTYGGSAIFNNAGQFVLSVNFADGTAGLLIASPTSTAPNQPPVAKAGPDRLMAETDVIVIDGSASHDPEGTVLSFVWSLNGVAISTGPKLSYGPLPLGATETLTLTVTDRGGASSTDSMTLTVVTNDPPVANAGPDQISHYLQPVTFDGTGSSDPEGVALEYVWTTYGPLRVYEYPQTAVLITLNGSAPTFTFDMTGTFDVTLTVTDNVGASASDSMTLTLTSEPPVANAGPDQTVQTLETVTMNGAGSTDPEGEALSYVWSAGGVEIGTGPAAVVGPFVAGSHTISLTVNDGHGGSASDTMVLTALNRPPVADAGPDMTVIYTEWPYVNGYGSSDPEGLPLSYAWTIDGAPVRGTNGALSVGHLSAGIYDIAVTVTDDHGATDTDNMILTVTNEAPVANAGPDQTVNHVQTVTLDGSGSTDLEFSTLRYYWTIDGVYVGNAKSPPVGPFAVGVYAVTLTVTDGEGLTDTDGMVLTVVNEVPIANAGPDQTVSVKGRTAAVTLDGSASGDPEGGGLSYLWTLNGQTVGTGAVLQVNVPAGINAFTLTVTDDHGATASDTVIVTGARGGA